MKIEFQQLERPANDHIQVWLDNRLANRDQLELLVRALNKLTNIRQITRLEAKLKELGNDQT